MPSTTRLPIETYIGDGVYASFDGFDIILDLREQNDSRIALAPEVLDALNAFAARFKAPATADTGASL